MASEYTTHRRYPLYTDQDKPNLRDQYNGAIRMIDEDIDDALDASGHASDALGAGFDAQHTVRMALDDTNAKFGSGVSSSNTVTDQFSNLSNLLPSNQFSPQNTIAMALGAKATQQQLSDAVSTLNARIDNIVSGTKYTAIVGDSWSDSNLPAAVWPSEYANVTHRSLINKAENGAGFVRTGTGGRGTTFYTQLQQVIADSNFGSCDELIILGGVNDRGYSADSVKAAIAQCAPLIRQIAASGRKVLFCFGNSGNGRNLDHGNYDAFVTEINNYAKSQLYLPAVDNVQWWLACSDVVLYNSDNLHPNATGNNMVASFMQQLHYGSYDGVHKHYVQGISFTDSSFTAEQTHCHARLDFDNGITKFNTGLFGVPLGVSETADMQVTDNFDNNTFWHSYGGGNSYNDGTEIYVKQITDKFNVVNSARALVYLDFHKYANAVFFRISGDRTVINSTQFPSGKMVLAAHFVV